MKKFAKVFAVIVVCALVLVGASVIFTKAEIDTPINKIGESVSNSMANALIDAADIKGKAQEALEASAPGIASATGLSESAVDSMIDDLGIQDWTVVSLPKDVSVADTNFVNYGGNTVEITSYSDPSIVTLSLDGTDVTFEIPDSAQGYVQYLKFLS